MKFNPEDANENAGTGNFGPHCRNCHRGASSCERCHADGIVGTSDTTIAAMNFEENYPEWVQAMAAWMGFDVNRASQFPYGWVLYGGLAPTIPTGTPGSFLEAYGFEAYQKTAFIRNSSERWYNERTVYWANNWRTNASQLSPICSDDGFSFPHRTMGWKMLKDELFGLDFDGSEVAVGTTRTALPNYIESNGNIATWSASSLPASLYNKVAHDLDSVCLDCHNPNIWNATSYDNYFDSWSRDDDNFNDELLLRGLP